MLWWFGEKRETKQHGWQGAISARDRQAPSCHGMERGAGPRGLCSAQPVPGLPAKSPHYTGPCSERLNSRSLCNTRGEQTYSIKVKQHISLQRALPEEPVQVSFGKGSLHNAALPNCSSNSELIILSLSWVFFSSLLHINCS